MNNLQATYFTIAKDKINSHNKMTTITPLDILKSRIC